MQNVLEAPGVLDTILRLDIDQYHRLCDSGIVPEKTELLEGVVVEKMGKSPLHSWTAGFLAEWFQSQLKQGLLLRVEQPLTLARSEPEPDLAVVVGSRGDFRNQHPGTAVLVVEVAITTVAIDSAKATVYGRAGIPEFWLVQPDVKKIIVFQNSGDAGYMQTRSLDLESVLSTSHCRLPLRLSDLFAE